jgi:hypothetical protein
MSHNTMHVVSHLAKHALDTETGKKAVKSTANALVALAPAGLVALATPLAPVVILGGLGYFIYRALNE